jgi:hypothetical protein
MLTKFRSTWACLSIRNKLRLTCYGLIICRMCCAALYNNCTAKEPTTTATEFANFIKKPICAPSHKKRRSNSSNNVIIGQGGAYRIALSSAQNIADPRLINAKPETAKPQFPGLSSREFKVLYWAASGKARGRRPKCWDCKRHQANRTSRNPAQNRAQTTKHMRSPSASVADFSLFAQQSPERPQRGQPLSSPSSWSAGK